MKRADQRKYHYIYKITRFDGKFYIGMHSTDDLEDGYFGSGKRLWFSINKHGKDKHTKEILEFLPNRASLKIREREIVNEALLGNPHCLNLCVGGEGKTSDEIKQMWRKPGFRDDMRKKMKKSWENNSTRSEETSKRTTALWKQPAYRDKLLLALSSRTHSKETKERIGQKNRNNWAKLSSKERTARSENMSEGNKRKYKDAAHKDKISEALKQPWKDPEFRKKMSLRNKGKIFINNGTESKLIIPSELESYLALGFVKGRLQKQRLLLE